MKLHRWILAVASRLVPKPLRTEWRAEWDAELHHRESSLRRWNRWDRPGRMDLVRRSAGALWDALWLQSSHWYSLRLFARHWRLSLTALLSLGAGISATVVGLAVSNALLLRPPGVTDPRSLGPFMCARKRSRTGRFHSTSTCTTARTRRRSRTSRRFRTRFLRLISAQTTGTNRSSRRRSPAIISWSWGFVHTSDI